MASATGFQAFLFDSAGVGEWMILLVVVLIVVGPKRLPEVARKLGRVMETIRRAADEFKRQIMTMDQPSHDDSTHVTDPSVPPEDDNDSEFDDPEGNPDYSPYPGNDGEYRRPYDDGETYPYGEDGSGGDDGERDGNVDPGENAAGGPEDDAVAGDAEPSPEPKDGNEA